MHFVVDLFLRAKHWQLFLIFALLGCVAIAAMLVSILSSPQEALNNVLPFFAGMEMLSIRSG